jgi:hypothetical protein
MSACDRASSTFPALPDASTPDSCPAVASSPPSSYRRLRGSEPVWTAQRVCQGHSKVTLSPGDWADAGRGVPNREPEARERRHLMRTSRIPSNSAFPAACLAHGLSEGTSHPLCDVPRLGATLLDLK